MRCGDEELEERVWCGGEVDHGREQIEDAEKLSDAGLAHATRYRKENVEKVVTRIPFQW